MGLLGKAMKLGLAKKVLNEARKPENQRRIKQLLNSATNSRGTGGKRPRRSR